ncbi:hypothetical protein N7478_011703 [Penicillium angulare]|uniref:uncharacterized protein n=1 Tax=Penicillium angulare TaxID=116970 RepID=UPI0025420168|nr:uncharacterized protein N7478_011703 [Penicillium angulare]KAJ5261108.1 hypothetical protein N7478_011703 [Penicillium angulare]
MAEFIPRPPSPSNPGSFPPAEGVPVAPPPWTLKAKAWTFLYSDVDQGNEPPPQNPNNTPAILQNVLPPGAYHPFETIHTEALQKLPGGEPQYRNGWIKGITIIRYEDSDVGPYDELILVPGKAVNPHTSKADQRISTIYVSTNASVWNGRRNWNIPKHRAVFSFTPSGSSSSDLEVRVFFPEDSPAPLDPKVPFFTALLKGSSLPKIPLPRLGPVPVVQPPLSKSRSPLAEDMVIATDDPENGRENPWLATKPSFKGSWGLAYPSTLEGELEHYGDGIGFPKIKLWSVGGAFEGYIGFGVPTAVS